MRSQNRRTFLRCAGAMALGAGLHGETHAAGALEGGAAGANQRQVRVRVEGPREPLVDRTVSILKERIEQRCPVEVIEVDTGAGEQLLLTVDPSLPAEAFRIEEGMRVCGFRGVRQTVCSMGRASFCGPAPMTARFGRLRGGVSRNRAVRCAGCISPRISTIGIARRRTRKSPGMWKILRCGE